MRGEAAVWVCAQMLTSFQPQVQHGAEEGFCRHYQMVRCSRGWEGWQPVTDCPSWPTPYLQTVPSDGHNTWVGSGGLWVESGQQSLPLQLAMASFEGPAF